MEGNIPIISLYIMKFSLFYPILKKKLALWNALFLGQKALEALIFEKQISDLKERSFIRLWG